MTRFQLPAHRRVQHLTLHREQRRISLKEYRALAASERLQMIRQSTGKEKYDLLLNAPDAEQLAPQLHPQEIYLTLHELGTDYATELLMLASTEQWTTMLDLDCWEGDELSEKSALHWLQMLLETGEEKICRTVREMEPELLALFLKKLIRVTRGPEAYDDDDAENANRLEGLYDIEYKSEDANKTVGALLTILLRHEQESYLLLLEMVRSELDSTLEEEVFNNRSNRLLDLGFTPTAEARAIYSYVDPESFTPATGKQFDLEAEDIQHPGALLARAEPADLLADILGNALTHEQATELAMLANRKLSADRTNVSDPKAVSESLQHLYSLLNLGLEHLSEREGKDAEQIFHDCYLLQIFQLGHSLVERLRRHAKDVLQSDIAQFLDGPYRRFIESLGASPPRLYCGIRICLNKDEKGFQTGDDLRMAEKQLHHVAIQQQLFAGVLPFALPDEESYDLKDCQPDQITDLTLSDLFLTALANRLLGREFAPQPIPAAELSDLHAIVSENKQLSPKILDETVAYLNSLLAGAGEFAEFCLEIWQEEFCTLEAKEIDPRYISGMIVRL